MASRQTNTDETTVEGQLVGWLARERFKVDASLSVAGATCVVEGYDTDRRICVCVGGSGGASLADWVSPIALFVAGQSCCEHTTTCHSGNFAVLVARFPCPSAILSLGIDHSRCWLCATE